MEPVYTTNFAAFGAFIVLYLLVAVLAAARYKRDKPRDCGIGEITTEATIVGLLWPISFVWSYFNQ